MHGVVVKPVLGSVHGSDKARRCALPRRSPWPCLSALPPLRSTNKAAPTAARSATTSGTSNGAARCSRASRSSTPATPPDPTTPASRSCAHVEVSTMDDLFSLAVDATMFTDRESYVLRPSEFDLTIDFTVRRAPFEVHLAYERDMPLDRGASYSNSSPCWGLGTSTSRASPPGRSGLANRCRRLDGGGARLPSAARLGLAPPSAKPTALPIHGGRRPDSAEAAPAHLSQRLVPPAALRIHRPAMSRLIEGAPSRYAPTCPRSSFAGRKVLAPFARPARAPAGRSADTCRYPPRVRPCGRLPTLTEAKA